MMIRHSSGGTPVKFVHYFSIACIVLAIGLLAAGGSGAAFFAFGLSIAVELVGSIITGKQTNDTKR
jgi:hypothetical protein